MMRSHREDGGMQALTRTDSEGMPRPGRRALTTRRLMILVATIAMLSATARWIAGLEHERTLVGVYRSGPSEWDIMSTRTHAGWLLGRPPRLMTGPHRVRK
jgi:hypothetical protein